MGETKPLNSTSFSVYFSFLFFFSQERASKKQLPLVPQTKMRGDGGKSEKAEAALLAAAAAAAPRGDARDI